MTPLRNDRGIALVITLLVVAILAITVLEFAFSVHVDAHMGRNALNSLQATLLARSGINLGEAVLLQDEESTFDSRYAEDWGDEDLINSQFILPPNMQLKVRIVDESGKLNINLTRPNWRTECRDIAARPPGREYVMWLEVLDALDAQLGDAIYDYWVRACEQYGSVQPAGAAGQTPPSGRTPTPAPTQAANATPTVDPLQIFVDFPSLDDFGATLGIPARRLEQLRKVVTALPTTGPRGSAKFVNGNTAPVGLLNVIVEDPDRRNDLMTRREEAGLTDQQVRQIAGSGQSGQSGRQGQTVTINPSRLLNGTSSFFLIRASAIINANPVTGRGGVRRSASMLVQRSLAAGRPGGSGGSTGATGAGAAPRWTLRQLDWQKEGGAALFTERSDGALADDSALDPNASGTRW